MEFFQKLRKLRDDKGLTQVQLSELTGIPQPMISQYEKGLKEPSVSNAKKIADALEVPLDDFFEE